MNVLMLRAKIKLERVAEVEAAIEKMFAAIDQAQPEGVRYASGKLADGVTFVVLLAIDNPADNPLTAVPEFGQFQDHLKTWIVEPPTAEPLTVLGSYRLF